MSIKEKYASIFAKECAQSYPVMDGLEQTCGFAVPKVRLEAAAEVLACPLKANPPNWQHGRLLYALARDYLRKSPGPGIFLDIGTAKGFSACVLSWAIEDAGLSIPLVSIDMMEPNTRERRNSVAELDGLKTVPEFANPFKAVSINPVWIGGGSSRWLKASVNPRILFAFVDGKHSYEAVSTDAAGLLARQAPGDIAVFDDVQIPAVSEAVGDMTGYAVEIITLSPKRTYAIATRQ